MTTDSVARERLREVADEASERTVEFLLGVLDAGLPLVLKPYSEWLDAVQAHCDAYHEDYPHPEEATLQRAYEVTDGSCWVNNASYHLSSVVYGYENLRECCELTNRSLSMLSRHAFTYAVLDAVKRLHEDREENQ